MVRSAALKKRTSDGHDRAPKWPSSAEVPIVAETSEERYRMNRPPSLRLPTLRRCSGRGGSGSPTSEPCRPAEPQGQHVCQPNGRPIKREKTFQCAFNLVYYWSIRLRFCFLSRKLGTQPPIWGTGFPHICAIRASFVRADPGEKRAYRMRAPLAPNTRERRRFPAAGCAIGRACSKPQRALHYEALFRADGSHMRPARAMPGPGSRALTKAIPRRRV